MTLHLIQAQLIHAVLLQDTGEPKQPRFKAALDMFIQEQGFLAVRCGVHVKKQSIQDHILTVKAHPVKQPCQAAIYLVLQANG